MLDDFLLTSALKWITLDLCEVVPQKVVAQRSWRNVVSSHYVLDHLYVIEITVKAHLT